MVVERGQREIGFKIKFLSTPKVTKSFWYACDDLQLDAACEAPAAEGWAMKTPAEVIPVMDIALKLQA